MDDFSESLSTFKIKVWECLKLVKKMPSADIRKAEQIWKTATEQFQALLQNSLKESQNQKYVGNEREQNEGSLAIEEKKGKGKSFELSNTCNRREQPEQNEDQLKDNRQIQFIPAPNVCIEEGQESSINQDNAVEDVDNDVNVYEKIENDTEADNKQEVQSVHLTISADPNLIPKRNHIRRFHKIKSHGREQQQHACDMCHRKFQSAEMLTRHRGTHVNNFECSICHQKLSSRNSLEVHKRRHTGEKPFECTKCLGKFTTQGNLKRHLATHTGEKPWQCSLCGNCFTEKKSLKLHIRIHTGERPHVCKICNKRFTQKVVLQGHLLTHTDQRKHLCDVCGRAFRQRAQLTVHKLRHDGVKKFKCQHCESRFTTKGDLERHVRTHTGERPYQCSICYQSFGRPQTLKEHRNRHFGIKPYVCKICGKAFPEMSASYRHVKGQHASEWKENNSVTTQILHITETADMQEVGDTDYAVVEVKEEGSADPMQMEVAKEEAIVMEEEEEEEDEEDDDEEGEEDEEEEEEDRDDSDGVRMEGDNHIFVMHSSEVEDTKLITIADHPDTEGDGKSRGLGPTEDCASFLTSVVAAKKERNLRDDGLGMLLSSRHTRNNHETGPNEEVRNEDLVGITPGDGEVAENALSHTISPAIVEGEMMQMGADDGTITTLALSQLGPVQLQLEGERYMVVLSSREAGEEAVGKKEPLPQHEWLYKPNVQ